MTKRELAQMLGYHEGTVLQMFQAVARQDNDISKTIKYKSRKSVKGKQVDFKLDEVLYVLKNTDFITPMEIQYVKENFIHRDTPYKIEHKEKLTRDEKIYIYWKSVYHKKMKVCNECLYCIPKRMQIAGSRFHPYCSFYNFFLRKRQMNVYKDCCETYTFRNKNEVRIWSRPYNTDLSSNKRSNKVLGIDNSEFISKRKKNEPIVLLGNNTEIYNDI